ncbi:MULTISPECIES: alpha-L-rhamnosidase C-terminal domain-containing protein [unclassified Streptomyces]|uniref:alpha-L-rhamnosidase C-terminal domain-containing protein n=1 Tax=unclassified Streptomyces TaxID=2593676 RepID=UPI002365B81B|nr:MULTISPECIES: alpha-L-rhamnosidase C-terminal domain-containing protein [unclassified Streptomyces]MDF3140437.1 alpha-L-rhamnosidase C-terminal domain-containing protein [Streptomyces sp. T21Q-yed]WDF35807.1 alpha-L-rhamnosidase C-terminal domain-containing protein [Streptomyces sp. T12]
MSRDIGDDSRSLRTSPRGGPARVSVVTTAPASPARHVAAPAAPHLAPLEPGYRRVLVAPRPGGGLTSASTRLATSHGEVSADCSRHPGKGTWSNSARAPTHSASVGLPILLPSRSSDGEVELMDAVAHGGAATSVSLETRNPGRPHARGRRRGRPRPPFPGNAVRDVRHQADPALRRPLGRPALPRQGNRCHGNEAAARRAITEPNNWASRWRGQSCRPGPVPNRHGVSFTMRASGAGQRTCGRASGPDAAVLPEPMAPARRPASHRVQRPCPASVGTGSALSRNSPSMRACSAW